jgi:hypothetical protein
MRFDPTIRLARDLAMAPVLASQWSVEATDDAPPGALTFIDAQIKPLRLHILRTAMTGCIDFGWQAFEKVFEIGRDGLYAIRKLKPLLQDITEILVDEKTGAFAGLRQSPQNYYNMADAGANGQIDLGIQECLLIAIDVEGTNWYGQSIMEVARKAFDQWNTVEAAADRYDRKVAGAHWVIHYPPGESNVDGVTTDNFEVARRFLNTLESSGSIAVPRVLSKTIKDLNGGLGEDAWKIDLLSDQGTALANFIDRQKYLDALKVRAFGMPERAILEGQFGTKAEAEAHADFAITNMEIRHQVLVQLINWHLINHLLRINWGVEVEDTVHVEPAPITDLDRIFLRDVYKAILTTPEGLASETATVDWQALRERLSIPEQPEPDQTNQLGQTDPNQGDSVTGIENHLPIAGQISVPAGASV